MSRFAFILEIIVLTAASLYAAGESTPAAEPRVSISAIEPTSLALNFNLADVSETPVERQGASYASFLLENEGSTYEYGKPALPAVSRFIIVPPDAGLALEVKCETQRSVQAVNAPAICWDEEIRGDLPADTPQFDGLYPPTVAEMSDPIVVRGVRMVKVTVHPVQFNPQTGTYLFHPQVETRIRYTDDQPVNPAEYPNRIHRSRQFLRYLEGLVENPEALPNRDDPEFISPYVGHYLIAARIEAINLARPFIEWRRKSGWRVDILPVSANDGNNNPTAVKNAIQQRYTELIQQGRDPFDHILIIGDRSDYSGLGPGPQWVIQSFQGNSVWPSPYHSDYEFGLLEGNDIHMDASVSRWPSGNQQTMELFVGRTLAYEANPRMQNPEWFLRGGVGSQHWGNTNESAWHVTIHTNVRWGVEVLEKLGYQDVRFQERYEWDQMGQVYGPWVRDLLNAGPNVILDRAENYFWRNDFNGVNNNTVFPVRLNLSGHGEWTTWNMIRTGDGNNLKGPVATTNGWGGPPTAPFSAVWLGLVHGVMIEDLTLGWGRIKGNTGIETFFPNINFGGQEIYREVKTDFDCYGDPGIQVWRGIPRLVEMNHPDTISLGTKLVEVYVHAPGDVQAPIEGAQVTLYVPGQLPQDAAQYAQHSTFMRTDASDRSGIVRFVLTGVNNFAAGDMFITATGRDIRPLFGRIVMVRPAGAPEIDDYTLEQIEGNDDDAFNPGESFRLNLTALNAGNRTALHNLTARIFSFSPWMQAGENQISFGDLDPNASAEGGEGVVLTLDASCPDAQARSAQQPAAIVLFDADEGSWRNAINIDVMAPNFTVSRLPGGNNIPAELRRVNVELRNIGRMNSSALTGRLVSLGMGISVIDDQMTFPAVNAGARVTNQGEGFLVSGNTIVPPGFINPMALIITTQSGFADTARFSLQVGTPRENAPTGPDRYGYICFDNTDQAWDIAPDYGWVEIDPRDQNCDFEGTALNFTGRSAEDVGETLVIPLGFETRYYDVTYDRISVCTNGFIAMGNQPNITNYQNWPLDRGFGGGAGMLAPFWDWLTLGQNGRVYYFYDEEDNRGIIEWSRLRHKVNGETDLTFQVILYDREIWITESGNQNILFQYRSIANVRGPEEDGQWVKQVPFASVGISSPDGLGGINYSWNNAPGSVSCAPIANGRALLFTTSPRYRAGKLYGHVYDIATNQPIFDARVFTEHGFNAFTNEEGYWEIPDALAEIPFDITAHKQGYNDSTRFELMVPENDSLEIDFFLLHPEFTPSTWELNNMMDPELQREMQFNLRNTGNGPLTWRMERRLLGDANASPWQFRRGYNVGGLTEDDRIEGVAFVQDRFYVTGRNGNRPTIYIFNREGALVDTFAQPGSDPEGLRDLTWDGELLWGTALDSVFGFTLQGQVERRFRIHFRPATAITWDPERSILWLAGTTTNLFAYNRDGEQQANVINRSNLRVYGLAYWRDDPDHHPLYIFHRDRDSGLQMIHKVNPDSCSAVRSDTIRVAALAPEDGGTPGGCFITNQFDVYSFVFIVISNCPRDVGDRIDIWQIAARRDWFQCDQVVGEQRREAISGTLQTGENLDFILTLNSAGLPDTLFQGELLFYHNADSGYGHIFVNLDVIGPMPPQQFDLIAPAENDTLDSTATVFQWQPSFDPNAGDDISYITWIKVGVDSLAVTGSSFILPLDLDTLGFDLPYLYHNPGEWWTLAVGGEDTVASNQRWTFYLLEPSVLNDPKPQQPVEYGFKECYPNPFNAATTITFGADKAFWTTLRAYDLAGRLAAELYNGVPEVGYQRVVWDAQTLPSGVYLLKLESGGRTKLAKMALVR